MKKERLPGRGHERLPNPVPTSAPNASVSLVEAVNTWVADGRAQGFSERTLRDRLGAFSRIRWWLQQVEDAPATLDSLTPDRVRRFLAYCREPSPDGRFGCAHPGARNQARPSTVHTYYRDLRAFSSFCIAEGLLDHDPLRNIKAPRIPRDQVKPFSPEQVQTLLDACRTTAAADRNRAILLLLLDTGLRASELCSLRVGDVSGSSSEITVTGKGNKQRSVYLGTATRRAIRQYLARYRKNARGEEPLFVGERGNRPGTVLTPTGVRSIVHHCGQIGGVEGVRCSPHTLRHTFAINFLRGGGNLFELQRLMGHTDLTVLRRYVAVAEADVAKAHRQASPADRMKLR